VDLEPVKHRARVASTLMQTGMFSPTRPSRAVRALAAFRRWGPTPAASYAIAAVRFPDRRAIVDDRGTVTFAEVQRRTNAWPTS